MRNKKLELPHFAYVPVYRITTGTSEIVKEALIESSLPQSLRRMRTDLQG